MGINETEERKDQFYDNIHIKKITINGVYYSIEEKEMKFKLHNETIYYVVK